MRGCKVVGDRRSGPKVITHLSAEEQRRREVAEAKSQLKNLTEYLEACHDFSLTLEVVTDATLTTQGDTTKPAGRLFPQRIVPWDDFPIQQEKVWDKLSTSGRFCTQRVYPSAHQLEYVQKYIDPISSELGLRHYARETVENPVRTLIEEVYRDEQLREELQLRGTMIFESHTSLPQPSETPIEEEIENMSITDLNASQAEGNPAIHKGSQDDKRGKQGNAGGPGRGGQGLLISSAYTRCQMAKGFQLLRSSISHCTTEEVINKEGDDFDFCSKSLVAAVITQLFSDMVRKGIQCGYIFVGEAIIFLYIPDDPITVRYHLSIPRLDFQVDDENRFHRTSVAQIFTFVLSALATEAPSQSWHDVAATLDTWAVEYIDILKNIPETDRKAPPDSAYKASRWKGFLRSPIRTRSRDVCSNPEGDQVRDKSDDEVDTPPSPTPKRAATAQRRGRRKLTAASRRGAGLGRKKNDTNDKQETELTNDRGRNADCKALYIKGSRGALFKVRLSSHGYTLVAKGMEKRHRKHLLQENQVYTQLRSIQGSSIPVCLGIVDLKLPYYYDGGIYVSMLFLSWAGRSIFQYLTPKNEASILGQVDRTLNELHKDVEPRNWLWDERHGRLMLIDFERAEIRVRPPLSTLSPNHKRNVQGDTKSETKDEEFHPTYNRSNRFSIPELGGNLGARTHALQRFHRQRVIHHFDPYDIDHYEPKLKMSFVPVNPRPMLQALVNKDVRVRLKWGDTEYKGTLIATDSYMNLQLANTEEYISNKPTSVLGQVLIRCNNVLWISANNPAKDEDTGMED
ncbi:hypothetical protein B7463_g11219, partial [Scytalidium lignicola]